MIKTFIDKLLGKADGAKSRKPRFGKRVEVPASVHGINPELVDRRAVDVVRTLQDAGFEAYIVGGAVRDLLLGLKGAALQMEHDDRVAFAELVELARAEHHAASHDQECLVRAHRRLCR